MTDKKSAELFERAKKIMPGGVNSPVRAFKSVGMNPRFIASGKGNRITDADGNEYIDFVGSWGPMILGHAQSDILDAVRAQIEKGLSFGACTELEVELAELICGNIPHVEMIRMVNSGTEAVMSAIRLARGFTGREKIIKFEGCYHGHSDSMLVKAGSGAMTFGEPDSAGVTAGASKDTLNAVYNDLDSVERLLKANDGNIAAVIVEPVAANMGVVPPEPGFLDGLRALCDKLGALLIFDEVICGFRLSFGGAAEYYGICPDLVTYGKIIGGGMPVGAYGGRREIMEKVSPLGVVYQAGTLSGNPIAMAAGTACLKKILADKDFYNRLNTMGSKFADELRAATGLTVNNAGSLSCVYHTKNPVRNYNEALGASAEKFSGMFKGLLERGIYVAPSQYEALFLNACFTEEDLNYVINSYRELAAAL